MYSDVLGFTRAAARGQVQAKRGVLARVSLGRLERWLLSIGFLVFLWAVFEGGFGDPLHGPRIYIYKERQGENLPRGNGRICGKNGSKSAPSGGSSDADLPAPESDPAAAQERRIGREPAAWQRLWLKPPAPGRLW